MTLQLPLFPDLLDRKSISSQDLRIRYGHAIWSVDSVSINRPRRGHEYVCIVVIYDDRRDCKCKNPNHWDVEIRHYTNAEETIVTGWGNSRRETIVTCQRFRCVTQSFFTRQDAIAKAEKIVALFAKLRNQN